MNTRVILAVIIALLLFGTVALAHSGEQTLPSWYVVAQEVASGGQYHLVGLTWQVSGTSSSRNYRLLAPESPTLRGRGCCCSFLPCALKKR
jgi:hypothetical protein